MGVSVEVICVEHRESLHTGNWDNVLLICDAPNKLPGRLPVPAAPPLVRFLLEQTLSDPTDIAYGHRMCRIVEAFEERHTGCALWVGCDYDDSTGRLQARIAKNLGFDFDEMDKDYSDEGWDEFSRIFDALLLREFNVWDYDGITADDRDFARAYGERMRSGQKSNLEPPPPPNNSRAAEDPHAVATPAVRPCVEAWDHFLNTGELVDSDLRPWAYGAPTVDLVQVIRDTPAPIIRTTL